MVGRARLGGVSRFSAVISPTELAELLPSEGLRVVDCRASLQNPEAGREQYRQGHLPGASFADLLQDLSGPILPGKTGRHPLPTIETFVARVRSWGIGSASQVVVYDDASGAFAARLWWLLRWLGHETVAVLDGGFPAWVAENRPVTTQAPILAVGDFSPRSHTDWLVQARELLQSAPRKLFDARAPERFRGDVEPIDPVAGHIPGAVNLPFADNLDNGRFRPPPSCANASPPRSTAPRPKKPSCTAAAASPLATTCSPSPTPACPSPSSTPAPGANGLPILSILSRRAEALPASQRPEAVTHEPPS
jgi:thiosulfate/3-mercaptopyruvate sulfurtransferase